MSFRDPDRRCDGVTRRELLRVGSLTAFGLGLADYLRLRAEGPAASTGRPRRTARACILIWLDGGPSHIDLFDPKPEAPREIRGPFRPIPTAVPGLQISEHLPRTARVAGRLAIIRSMTSPLGEHNLGSHYLLTGYQPSPALSYPSLGAVVSRVARSEPGGDRLLPPYVAVGNRPNSMVGSGYLPAAFAPFVAGGDPARPDYRVADLDSYPLVTEDRLRRRRDFLWALDSFSRRVESAAGAEGAPSGFEAAYRLVTSPRAKEAFDLSRESRSVRERFGPRTLGQSCLLARRLVERGVPFVTVTDTGWDTHDDIYNRLKEGYTGGTVGKVPVLDQALAALIEDLDQRGLLAETLVLVMGEFGRTPKINTAGGRDHWPRVFSVALAGACVPGGTVVGRSDSLGESPADRPVTPADLASTVFTILGIDPDREFTTADGRPVRINSGGEPIGELLG